MSFQVESRFIGEFKTGDNIQYNLQAIRHLYDRFTAHEDRELIAKPIIILLASINEAMLYDLISYRIQLFTREGIANIEIDSLERIRNITASKFTVVIAQCKKHDLLQDESIYDDLQILLKMRNRIHIQNESAALPADECHLFDSDAILLAERTTEFVAKKLMSLYPRPYHYVGPFEFPWEAHQD